MSKLFKGVKKIFKKVVKAVKKIAPIALMVAAIVFTGGAALGVAGMAGGWGGAAAGLAAKMGLTGTLGSVVTGAITQAGYGAAIGGLLGGSEGAKSGAIGGALTGGVMGGLGMATDPLAGIGSKAAPSGMAPGASLEPFGGAGPDMSAGASRISDSIGGGVSAGGEVTGAGVPGTPGKGLLGPGGWLERNQTLVGGAVKGLGQGLLSGSESDARVDAMREEQRLLAANYGSADPGAGYQPLAAGTQTKTPTQRFDPATYGQFEYRYNPGTGRIERVPIANA